LAKTKLATRGEQERDPITGSSASTMSFTSMETSTTVFA
jgi:hypothetical protein